MFRIIVHLWLTAIAALLLPGVAFAQEPFYKGKTVRIIVGASAGGGYDIYSRILAGYVMVRGYSFPGMGKYIPGNPRIVVENMPGTGFLISANYMYKVAKPDGLTIGHFIGGLFFSQLLEKSGIEFDARKFEYIGVPVQENYTIGLSKASGITSMEQWLSSKTAVKLGGVGPGTATDDIPKVLMATLGLPVQLVTGYKGTGDIRRAFHSGEVDGVCNVWDSFKATWRKELESGAMIIVVQNIPKPHPDLPNVPLDINFAKTDEARKLIQAFVHGRGSTARPYVLPPGTPRERVEILRTAFMAAMKDPEFLADATRSRLDINPLDGAELERNVREVFNLSPALVLKAKEILK